MEIKYIVNGKEFDNEAEAKAYEQELNIADAQYSVGDKIYILNYEGLLEHQEIESIDAKFGQVCYRLKNHTGVIYESNIYETPEDYFEYIRTNIKEF